MARILDEDYAYATARIRALENKLITPQQYQRMLDAASAEDIVKMLVELGYGAGVLIHPSRLSYIGGCFRMR